MRFSLKRIYWCVDKLSIMYNLRCTPSLGLSRQGVLVCVSSTPSRLQCTLCCIDRSVCIHWETRATTTSKKNLRSFFDRTICRISDQSSIDSIFRVLNTKRQSQRRPKQLHRSALGNAGPRNGLFFFVRFTPGSRSIFSLSPLFVHWIFIYFFSFAKHLR